LYLKLVKFLKNFCKSIDKIELQVYNNIVVPHGQYIPRETKVTSKRWWDSCV